MQIHHHSNWVKVRQQNYLPRKIGNCRRHFQFPSRKEEEKERFITLRLNFYPNFVQNENLNTFMVRVPGKPEQQPRPRFAMNFAGTPHRL